MHSLTKILTLTALLSLLTQSAFAQLEGGGSVGRDATAVGAFDEYGRYFWLRHNLGDGVGYYDGYSNLGAFLPFAAQENSLWFVDARSLLTNQGRAGGNLGLGYRAFNADYNHVLGGGAWIDADQLESLFTQVGVSAEYLGERFEVRGNAYYPFGSISRTYGQVSTATAPTYVGNNISLGQTSFFRETALSGFDLEVGGPLPVGRRYGLSGYVGMYQFEQEGVDRVLGGRVRLAAQPLDNIGVNFVLSSDDLYDVTAVVGATWTFPARRSPGAGTRGPVRDRLYGLTERNGRIMSEQKYVQQNNLATIPGTSQPIHVVHVDDDAAAGGDGTAERPLSNLLFAEGQSQAGSIIFVRQGTYDLGAEGFNVATGQRLLGDGLLTANPHMVVSNEGTFALPGQVAGATPVIISTNSLGAVQLFSATGVSANVEVAGFNVQSSSAGILGVLNNGFSIHDNTLAAGGQFGILMVNGSGTTFNNATAISSGNSITNNIVTGQQFGGIAVTNIDLSSLTGIPAGLPTQPAGALTVTLNDNTVTGNGNGGALPATGLARDIATASGFDARYGVAVSNNTSQQITATLTGNTINTNGSSSAVVPGEDRVSAGVLIGATGTARLNVDIVDNTSINANRGAGVLAAAADNAQVIVDINNSSITDTQSAPVSGFGFTGTAAAGAVFVTEGQARVRGTITNSVLDGAGVGGSIDSGIMAISTDIVRSSPSPGNIDLSVVNTDVFNWGGSGVHVQGNGSTRIRAAISAGTLIGNNDGDGVHIEGAESTILEASLRTTEVFGNAGHGMSVFGTEDAQVYVTAGVGAVSAGDVWFYDNTGAGVRVNASVDANVDVLLRRTDIFQNTQEGVIGTSPSSVLTGMEFTNNRFGTLVPGGGANGMEDIRLGSLDFQVNFVNNSGDGPFDIGVIASQIYEAGVNSPAPIVAGTAAVPFTFSAPTPAFTPIVP